MKKTRKKPLRLPFMIETTLIVTAGVVLDQLTKAVALRAFPGSVVGNAGFLGGSANFSHLAIANAHVIGLGISFALTALAVSWETHKTERAVSLGLVVTVSGVLGNLIDRLFRWSVVDFIHFGSGATNVADILQWVGVFLIVVGIVRYVARVNRGEENRRPGSARFLSGKKASRLALIGFVICLVGSEVAASIFIHKLAPDLFGAWMTLLLAFDLPMLYLIYRLTVKVASLSEAPVHATIRMLEQFGKSGKKPDYSFRTDEAIPELASALNEAVKRMK